jgi:hypothetical protein
MLRVVRLPLNSGNLDQPPDRREGPRADVGEGGLPRACTRMTPLIYFVGGDDRRTQATNATNPTELITPPKMLPATAR